MDTFKLKIDGERIGAGAETAATLKLAAQGAGTLKDPETNKFLFPGPAAKGHTITLPFEIDLPTDVTTGVSETVGYTVVVETKYGGKVKTSFAAQAADSEHDLTDLTETVVTPIADTQLFRNQAEAAAALAEGYLDDVEDARDLVLAVPATNDGIIAGRVNDPASATATALSAAFGRQPLRLVEETQFVISTPLTQPRPIDAIGPVLYGATDGVKLHRSTDKGTTWTLVKDFGAGSAILGLRALPDGEVLLIKRSDGLYKSDGWAANPTTATWTQVRAPSAGAWMLPWGVDVSDTGLCVAVEYALTAGDRTASRMLWTSTDSGDTWTQRMDLNAMHPGQESMTHWHSAGIDHFTTPERVWAAHGDGVKGLYYTDADDLTDWTLVSNAHQPTVLVDADLGMIGGTDEIPDGLQFVERRAAGMAVEQLYTARYPSGGLAYQTQRGLRTREGHVLVGASAQPAGAPHLLLSSSDGGATAYELARWTPTNPAESANLSHIAADDDGYVYVVFTLLDGVNQWLRYRAVKATGPTERHLEPADKNSWKSPGAFRAEGSGTATGVGADAGTDRGTAAGYQSKATGSRSQARGASSNASATFADADGYLAAASASGAVAKGPNSSASAQDAFAAGSGANAGHPRSIAFPGETTTAADQVQVGDKHLELVEVTDPTAPDGDRSRLYAADVEGVTRMRYRTASGTHTLATTGDLVDTPTSGGTQFVRKTADTARTADATRTNDPHLTLAVAATKTYTFKAVLFYDASTAGDLQVSFDAPAGSTIVWGQVALNSGATSAQSAPRLSAVSGIGLGSGGLGGAGVGTRVICVVEGILRTGGAAENLTLQWAQSASDAVATTVAADSFMEATERA